MIRAEAHSDDRVYEISFDATPWFEQATTRELDALASCDFGGDYPADEVARYCADMNPELAAMFDYVRREHSRGIGFECYILDVNAAEKFIRKQLVK